MNRLLVLIVALVVLGVAAAEMLQPVDAGSVAVVQQGKDQPVLLGPGLHVTLPPPFASVTPIDTRVQTLALAGPFELSTADQAKLLITPTLNYRVTDPLKFYTAAAGDTDKASQRLGDALKRALTQALAQRSQADALANQSALSEQALNAMQGDAAQLGVQLVDLGLARVDLPEPAADKVYQQMRAAQEQQASETRATGVAKVDQVQTAAAREQQAVRDDANRSAQAVKDEGDAQAATLLAGAAHRDPQFYAFFASLEAYRNSIHPGDVIVVGPDSPFYRFMRDPAGNAAAAMGSASATVVPPPVGASAALPPARKP